MSEEKRKLQQRMKDIKIKYVYAGVLILMGVIYGPRMAVGIMAGMVFPYLINKNTPIGDIFE